MCIVYDKLFKPLQSFWITLYIIVFYFVKRVDSRIH